MNRSSKKGPFIAYHLLQKINNNKANIIIKTWSRASMIIPCMLGYTITIYNGKQYIPLFITNQLIGHKLGEFSVTKHFFGHTKDEKKIKHLKNKK